MKQPLICRASALGSVLLMVPALVFGHHSFAAEWDANNCRDFTGVLTKIDWQNPHPYFYVDVREPDGTVATWSFQAYSPVTLRRNGTDRQVFLQNVGKELWVRGCLAKNGKPYAAAAGTLRFADGVLRQVGQIQN